MRHPVIRQLLEPTIWLSNKLSFSGKYLLIGVVVLLSLSLLSVPILQRTDHDLDMARQELFGIRQYDTQMMLLFNLIELRSALFVGGLDQPLVDSVSRQMQRLANTDDGSPVDRVIRVKLLRAWLQWQALQSHAPREQLFAGINGITNNLLELIRQSARISRIYADPEIDNALIVLSSGLPKLMETVGRQDDAYLSGNALMMSYAMGDQIILTESVANFSFGLAQLLAVHQTSSTMVSRALKRLLPGIARQQDIVDEGGENYLDTKRRLHQIVNMNLIAGHALELAGVETAQQSIHARISRYQRYRISVLVVLLLAISAVGYLFIGAYFSTMRSLQSLSNGTAAFRHGQLDARITIDARDELVAVAGDFNQVAVEFSRLMAIVREKNEIRQRELEQLVNERTAQLAEKNNALVRASQRVQAELTLARNMQQAILPQHFPGGMDWNAHAVMIPARELGGDFYDCIELPDGRIGLLVADVSGKGVGAAFFMAVSRTVLLDLALTGQSPAWVLEQANNLLCERNPMELFVTVMYAIFSPEERSLVCASAGHSPPLLRQTDGCVETMVMNTGVALGIMPGMGYHDVRRKMFPQETVLMYTDGVTEAFSPTGEEYGVERLARWFAKQESTTPKALVDLLLVDVAGFVAGAESSDDLTCLVLMNQ